MYPDHQNHHHDTGTHQSWEAIPPDTAAFTPDISPLILAAHTDNYEIIKILLDRGAVLPCPHHQRYQALLPSPHHQRSNNLLFTSTVLCLFFFYFFFYVLYCQ